MMQKLLFVVSFASVFALGFGQFAGADEPIRHPGSPPELVLYAGAGLSGRNIVIRADEPKLLDREFADIAQSMQINGGRWEVCTQKRYRNRCEVFSPGRYSLNDLGWGRDIASVRRLAPDTHIITLFSERDFGGRARTFARKMDKLKLYAFNDHAASLRVDGGTWKVCANSSLGGTCQLVDRDIANLSDIGLRHQVSSVGPTNAHIGNARSDVGEIILFDSRGFTGTRVSIRREVSDLRRAGFTNRASSVQLDRGNWQVCEQTNFRGHCEIINRSVRNLNRLDLNNRISSVRPYRYEPDVGPGYRSGWDGRNKFGTAAEGQRTIFFAAPTINGHAVADCMYLSRQCGQPAATAFCQAAGLDRAVYYEALRGHRPLWYIGRASTKTGYPQSKQLIDVLCTR